MRFSKYEGLGNDFIVVDASAPDALTPARAAELCDRRFGVGADGVLLVTPPSTAGAAATMTVLNADGSVPEMCGNGLRCVALHLASGGGPSELVVDTGAGPRACSVTRDGDRAVVSVDMGEVRSEGPRAIEVDGERYEVWTGDAGNPHAILFGRASRAEAERVGPRIEKHPSFPRGTNVEFASVQGARIDLVVWERGVGITLACGTGACATAVVARERGLVPATGEIEVALLGGVLRIDPQPAGRTTMIGPARLVFSGAV